MQNYFYISEDRFKNLVERTKLRRTNQLLEDFVGDYNGEDIEHIFYHGERRVVLMTKNWLLVFYLDALEYVKDHLEDDYYVKIVNKTNGFQLLKNCLFGTCFVQKNKRSVELNASTYWKFVVLLIVFLILISFMVKKYYFKQSGLVRSKSTNLMQATKTSSKHADLIKKSKTKSSKITIQK